MAAVPTVLMSADDLNSLYETRHTLRTHTRSWKVG